MSAKASGSGDAVAADDDGTTVGSSEGDGTSVGLTERDVEPGCHGPLVSSCDPSGDQNG